MKVEQKLDILQHIALYMKLTIRVIQQDVLQVLKKSSRPVQRLSTDSHRDDTDAFAKRVKGRQQISGG